MMKKYDRQSKIFLISLILITIILIYLFPEQIKLNPWTMNEKIKCLEERVKSLENYFIHSSDYRNHIVAKAEPWARIGVREIRIKDECIFFM